MDWLHLLEYWTVLSILCINASTVQYCTDLGGDLGPACMGSGGSDRHFTRTRLGL